MFLFSVARDNRTRAKKGKKRGLTIATLSQKLKLAVLVPHWSKVHQDVWPLNTPVQWKQLTPMATEAQAEVSLKKKSRRNL